jgi:hypothetical protein
MQRNIRPESEAYKEILCRFFIDSHHPFDTRAIQWPDLDPDSLSRLRSLPFWSEAVATERATACTVRTFASTVTDPLLHEAIALQAYEEERHAAMLQDLTAHYGIAVPVQPEPAPPQDAEWAFLCTGYSECFDAFFTFALFAIARDSGFFPPALVACFEPVIQEEARHILFFVNWEAYTQARCSPWQRPRHLWRGVLGRGLQVWHRFQIARGMRQQGDFTLKGHQTLPTTISPRGFLGLCLQENERRLSCYDRRLRQPCLVPTIAKMVASILW